MKRQSGINMVAVIIGVIIGLIIVAVGGFLILSNGNDEPTVPPVTDEQPMEDNEITEDEKLPIENYLEKIAYVAINGELANSTGATGTETSTISQEQAMIYMATMDLEPEGISGGNLNNTNTINNNGNNNLPNMNLSNANNITNNSLSNIPVTNTLNTNIVGNTIDNTLTNVGGNTLTPQNTWPYSEETIQDALFEIFGQQLENLSQILQTTPIEDNIVLPRIIQIEDMTKSNGIYTVVYTACLPTAEDIQNGTNIYGLTQYSIQVKFEKNDNPLYSDYKLSTMNIVSETTPIAYHISYVDGKYGVIDNNGIVIIEAKYSRVVLPNSYVGLFICYTDDTTPPVFLNERGVTQFKDFDSASLIQATSDSEATWYEDNIILVQKDGFYGAVDYKGQVIYDVEYQAIEPLGYEREKLVLTKDGAQALADTHGNILSDFAYTEIGILGVDFDSTVLVTPTRTQEQVIEMMQQNDYIIGQSAAGTYTILETKSANEPVPAIMSTNAKEYQMTIGTWQLALLDNVIPVYVKQVQ